MYRGMAGSSRWGLSVFRRLGRQDVGVARFPVGVQGEGPGAPHSLGLIRHVD